jgi:hypothetical protein
MAAGFREGFVEANGFRIRYMEAGMQSSRSFPPCKSCRVLRRGPARPPGGRTQGGGQIAMAALGQDGHRRKRQAKSETLQRIVPGHVDACVLRRLGSRGRRARCLAIKGTSHATTQIQGCC